MGIQETIEIIPLRSEDLDQVAALEKLCFTLPWSKKLFQNELQNPDLCYWLALKKTGQTGQVEILGYAGFWKAVDEAHITNLAVHPAHQHKGLGQKLVNALLDLAKSLGCLRATLEVRASNQPAISLYQKLGFQIIAMRPKYYSDNQEDALIMWKQQI